MQNMESTTEVNVIIRTNNENLKITIESNESKVRTAKIADAKFGLPKVEIMELYGLFHFTKSFPVNCMIP